MKRFRLSEYLAILAAAAALAVPVGRWVIPALVAFHAAEAEAAVRVNGDGGKFSCTYHQMCVDQTATGACGGSGSERWANLDGRYHHTISSAASTATSWSCDLMCSDREGYQASRQWQVNGSSITNSVKAIYVDAALEECWIECSAITAGGGNVDISIKSCPAGK